MGEIAVDTADFEAAATQLRHVREVAAGPPVMLAGAHDTHAARLDAALDEFARQASAGATALLSRAELLEGAAVLAARGLSVLELGLVRVLDR